MTKRTTGVLFWSYLIVSGLATAYGYHTADEYAVQSAIVYGFLAGSLWLGLYSGVYILFFGKTPKQSKDDPYEDLML